MPRSAGEWAVALNGVPLRRSTYVYKRSVGTETVPFGDEHVRHVFRGSRTCTTTPWAGSEPRTAHVAFTTGTMDRPTFWEEGVQSGAVQ
ncbi:hypothetical protein ASD81_04150 [Nocardioides sp. Root614]|nr:hypothetical protein ASD81_04150 [Nocardioides sp. Root614]KRA91843.1 hypothetical protein ASD84_04415 [Nocardioides sp. Root682]